MARTRSSEGPAEPCAEVGGVRKTSSAGFSRISLLERQEHAVRDARKKMLRVAIGRSVRVFRTKLGIRVADLAATIQVSSGMLSKIENGSMSPSLTTLQALSRALAVPITAFLRRFEEERRAIFVKAGAAERRGTRAGHQRNLRRLLGSNTSGAVVVPCFIVLREASDIFPTFQHGGIEFVYMLEGEVVYRHGSNLYAMTAGDSLFFEANVPHGPEELRELPIRYLLITSYSHATIKTATGAWRRKQR